MTVPVSFYRNHLFIEHFRRPQAEDFLKKQTFRLASYLTDPICKAHELFRRVYVVDTLNPSAFKISNWARKFFMGIGVIVSSFLSIGSTVPGVCLRGLTSYLEDKPFIYYQGGLPNKQLDDHFSLLSWNVCCVGGGYSISDGGVMPWRFRIDKIIAKIAEQQADVICLYEILDTTSGFYLCEKLQDEYAQFYFNIGPRAIGPSSGIFVASKTKITNPEFIPFPKHMLIGRTKVSEKGIFSFSIQTRQGDVKIYATHLQHSEEPQYSTDEEIQARKKEMDLIMEKVEQEIGNVVVTGDLNLDGREYAQSSWAKDFQKIPFIENSLNTWGGDKFCAEMVGKRVSDSLILDYTLATEKSALNIETALITTGYDDTTFTIDALSDHNGLLSLIKIDRQTELF